MSCHYGGLLNRTLWFQVPNSDKGVRDGFEIQKIARDAWPFASSLR
jgi:hypothetical protein